MMERLKKKLLGRKFRLLLKMKINRKVKGIIMIPTWRKIKIILKLK
jgi:ribosomal protein L39E